MTYSEEQIKEIVEISKAYAQLALSEDRLNREEDQVKRLRLAAQIRNRDIPFYKVLVPEEVQRELLKVDDLAERCENLLAEYSLESSKKSLRSRPTPFE